MRAAEIFGTNMVLQRNTNVPVWGGATPNEEISVHIQGQTVKTVADQDGIWNLSLDPLKASMEETMVIKGQDDEIRFDHIAIGEVWIASGQSNMEFHMRYDKDFDTEVKNCLNKQIRFFDYPLVASEKAREIYDFSENFGFWRSCDPENLQWFSAVGYYFSKYLQPSLNVPIGIVGLNCGGSRSCSWMDEETIKQCGPIWLEDYEKGLAAVPNLKEAEQAYYDGPMGDHTHPFENEFSDRMMYGVSLEELKSAFSNMSENGGLVIGPWHEWRPAGLYHTMAEHVMPYAAKGVLWYQGESDEDHPEIYADMMKGLIKLWRSKWGRELPFILAQLAPFGMEIGNGGKFYPILREQQEKVSKEVEQVYLVPTGDVGNVYDIHPKEKQPIGKRMALLARGHVYGEDILCDAPIPEKAVRSGRQIRISFHNADGGLILKGDRVNALEILNEKGGKEITGVTAEAEGNELLIRLPDVQDEEPGVRILFAKTPFFEVNLYNQADIPVLPFEIRI